MIQVCSNALTDEKSGLIKVERRCITCFAFPKSNLEGVMMADQKKDPDNEMSKPGRKGIQRVLWAAYYSYRGIRSAIQNEAAFRQELALMLFLIPLAFWLGETVEQQILLIGPCVLVVVVELLNSAIEAVVDRIGSERHVLSGQAKDMGSAAVFFSLLLVVVSWGLIGWNRFFG